jgi:DNA-binding NarL/FixJ family response regulator
MRVGLEERADPAVARLCPGEKVMIRRGGRTRILIADDHTLVAEGCVKLLEPEFEILATVRDGLELIQAAEKMKPDVIIADISMPMMNGLDACEQIKQKMKTVKIIYLTMNEDKDLAAEAFRRGASGYLLKSSAAAELSVAVRAVMRSKSYVSPLITRDLVGLLIESDRKDPGHERLTERQKQVVQLLAEGRSMKEVASVLNITTRTVAFHKYRIMGLLGLKNNAELVQYAIRKHLIFQ